MLVLRTSVALSGEGVRTAAHSRSAAGETVAFVLGYGLLTCRLRADRSFGSLAATETKFWTNLGRALP